MFLKYGNTLLNLDKCEAISITGRISEHKDGREYNTITVICDQEIYHIHFEDEETTNRAFDFICAHLRHKDNYLGLGYFLGENTCSKEPVGDPIL